MKGDMVIVRDYANNPLILKVWDVRGDVIFVTNDDTYRLLSDGEKAAMPIGFPREDVFRCTLKLVNTVKKKQNFNAFDWNKAVPYIE